MIIVSLIIFFGLFMLLAFMMKQHPYTTHKLSIPQSVINRDRGYEDGYHDRRPRQMNNKDYNDGYVKGADQRHYEYEANTVIAGSAAVITY